MSESGFEAALSYVMNRVEEDWRTVAPPTYFTTVRDAGWANFGPPKDEDHSDKLVSDSTDDHFVRLWVEAVYPEGFKQDNVGELSPIVKVSTITVVRAPNNLQRQMAAACTTQIAVYLGNPDRLDPNYAGQNTTGLFTSLDPSWGIRWRYPTVAGAYGVGLVWGMWNVGYIHPWPKG